MSDLCSSNSALFDSVFVEIKNPHGKNSIIGTGFRNNHLTALALIDLINNISSAIDGNETT